MGKSLPQNIPLNCSVRTTRQQGKTTAKITIGMLSETPQTHEKTTLIPITTDPENTLSPPKVLDNGKK